MSDSTGRNIWDLLGDVKKPVSKLNDCRRKEVDATWCRKQELFDTKNDDFTGSFAWLKGLDQLKNRVEDSLKESSKLSVEIHGESSTAVCDNGRKRSLSPVLSSLRKKLKYEMLQFKGDCNVVNNSRGTGSFLHVNSHATAEPERVGSCNSATLSGDSNVPRESSEVVKSSISLPQLSKLRLPALLSGKSAVKMSGLSCQSNSKFRASLLESFDTSMVSCQQSTAIGYSVNTNCCASRPDVNSDICSTQRDLLSSTAVAECTIKCSDGNTVTISCDDESLLQQSPMCSLSSPSLDGFMPTNVDLCRTVVNELTVVNESITLSQAPISDVNSRSKSMMNEDSVEYLSFEHSPKLPGVEGRSFDGDALPAQSKAQELVLRQSAVDLSPGSVKSSMRSFLVAGEVSDDKPDRVHLGGVEVTLSDQCDISYELDATVSRIEREDVQDISSRQPLDAVTVTRPVENSSCLVDMTHSFEKENIVDGKEQLIAKTEVVPGLVYSSICKSDAESVTGQSILSVSMEEKLPSSSSQITDWTGESAENSSLDIGNVNGEIGAYSSTQGLAKLQTVNSCQCLVPGDVALFPAADPAAETITRSVVASDPSGDKVPSVRTGAISSGSDKIISSSEFTVGVPSLNAHSPIHGSHCRNLPNAATSNGKESVENSGETSRRMCSLTPGGEMSAVPGIETSWAVEVECDTKVSLVSAHRPVKEETYLECIRSLISDSTSLPSSINRPNDASGVVVNRDDCLSPSVAFRQQLDSPLTECSVIAEQSHLLKAAEGSFDGDCVAVTGDECTNSLNTDIREEYSAEASNRTQSSVDTNLHDDGSAQRSTDQQSKTTSLSGSQIDQILQALIETESNSLLAIADDISRLLMLMSESGPAGIDALSDSVCKDNVSNRSVVVNGDSDSADVASLTSVPEDCCFGPDNKILLDSYLQSGTDSPSVPDIEILSAVLAEGAVENVPVSCNNSVDDVERALVVDGGESNSVEQSAAAKCPFVCSDVHSKGSDNVANSVVINATKLPVSDGTKFGNFVLPLACNFSPRSEEFNCSQSFTTSRSGSTSVERDAGVSVSAGAREPSRENGAGLNEDERDCLLYSVAGKPGNNSLLHSAERLFKDYVTGTQFYKHLVMKGRVSQDVSCCSHVPELTSCSCGSLTGDKRSCRAALGMPVKLQNITANSVQTSLKNMLSLSSIALGGPAALQRKQKFAAELLNRVLRSDASLPTAAAAGEKSSSTPLHSSTGTSEHVEECISDCITPVGGKVESQDGCNAGAAGLELKIIDTRSEVVDGSSSYGCKQEMANAIDYTFDGPSQAALVREKFETTDWMETAETYEPVLVASTCESVIFRGKVEIEGIDEPVVDSVTERPCPSGDTNWCGSDQSAAGTGTPFAKRTASTKKSISHSGRSVATGCSPRDGGGVSSLKGYSRLESCRTTRGGRRKQRTLLQQLASSDGYVADKRHAESALLGREERALQMAWMRIREMEQLEELKHVKSCAANANDTIRRNISSKTVKFNATRRKIHARRNSARKIAEGVTHRSKRCVKLAKEICVHAQAKRGKQGHYRKSSVNRNKRAVYAGRMYHLRSNYGLRLRDRTCGKETQSVIDENRFEKKPKVPSKRTPSKHNFDMETAVVSNSEKKRDIRDEELGCTEALVYSDAVCLPKIKLKGSKAAGIQLDSTDTADTTGSEASAGNKTSSTGGDRARNLWNLLKDTVVNGRCGGSYLEHDREIRGKTACRLDGVPSNLPAVDVDSAHDVNVDADQHLSDTEDEHYELESCWSAFSTDVSLARFSLLDESFNGGRNDGAGEDFTERSDSVFSSSVELKGRLADGRNQRLRRQLQLSVVRSDIELSSVAMNEEKITTVPFEVKRITTDVSTGETVLHKAARLGYVDVALWCCQTGYIDVNVRNNADYTPLHECCATGHTAVAECLIFFGADIHAVSRLDGARPLHDAVESDNIETVRLLLSAGADIALTNYSGQTVFQLCQSAAMTQFLQAYTADLNGVSEAVLAEDSYWHFEPSWKGDVFDDILSRVPHDRCDDDLVMECSEEQLPPVYSLQLDRTAKFGSFLLLADVLSKLCISSRHFSRLYPDMELDKISWQLFKQQTMLADFKAVERRISLVYTGDETATCSSRQICYDNNQFSDVFRLDDRQMIDVLKMNDRLRHLIGVSCFKLRIECRNCH